MQQHRATADSRCHRVHWPCHDKASIDFAKLVIASDAALAIKFRKENNIEVEAAKEKGIPVIHRAKMLAALMRLKEATAVGDSRKSTTTSMAVRLLEDGKLMPTVVSGAVMNLYGSNAHLSSGGWMEPER